MDVVVFISNYNTNICNSGKLQMVPLSWIHCILIFKIYDTFTKRVVKIWYIFIINASSFNK